MKLIEQIDDRYGMFYCPECESVTGRLLRMGRKTKTCSNQCGGYYTARHNNKNYQEQCRALRLRRMDEWKKILQGTGKSENKRRAVGLFLKAAMYIRGEGISFTISEAAQITGLGEEHLAKLFKRFTPHEDLGKSRFIYHTINKIFYYDGE